MNTKEMEALIQRKGTPAYVFDLGVLKSRIAFLRKHLPEEVELCYAVKANTFIVRELSEWVDWLEICSPGELQICKKLAIPEEKYVISGVYKDAGMVDREVGGHGSIGYFTVESENQFRLLRDTAKKYDRKIRIQIRLTSGNQFGVDKSVVFQLVEQYRNDPYVEIGAIQFFSGTQKTSLKKLHRELMYIKEVLEELQEKHEFCPEKLEYGPGFPVSYFEGETFDEPAFLETFSEYLSELQFDGKIVLELGRSIAASCGTYWTGVVDTKCNRGEKYAIVDGGMHQFVYYGQMMAMKHPNVKLFPEREEAECEEWNICGSLCTINDILVKRYPFSGLKPGDMLMFENTGAYCVTEGIALFLSRDLPKVILVHEDGTHAVARESMETNLWNTPI